MTKPSQRTKVKYKNRNFELVSNVTKIMVGDIVVERIHKYEILYKGFITVKGSMFYDREIEGFLDCVDDLLKW